MFDIHQELLRLQDKEILINNELIVPDYGSRELDKKLNALVDRMSDPGVLLDPDTMDTTKSFIKYLPEVSGEQRLTITDMVMTAVQSLIDTIKQELNASNVQEFKELVLKYVFVVFWMSETLEGINKKTQQEPVQKKKKTLDWPSQKERLSSLMLKILQLDLKRLVDSASERSVLVSTICKTVSIFIEEPDHLKQIKPFALDILAVAAMEYDQKVGILSKIMQNIKEEHLSEMMAEFLHLLHKSHDDSELVEKSLKELKDLDLSDKDLKLSKSISLFLMKLSELVPELVLKQMVYLQSQLDSESYNIRCTMIEVVGNLIQYLVESNQSTPVSSFYQLLETRFRDVSSFVRSRLLNVLSRLSMSNAMPIAVRMDMIKLATGRLRDKSSNVRKNAIKFLIRMIETAPFIGPKADEAKLSLNLFESRLEQLQQVITSATNEEELVSLDPEQIQNYTTLQKYYSDAVKFCNLILNGSLVILELLGSSNRIEVVEAMNFFVVAQQKSMEFAIQGTRQMVHKVWDKDLGERQGTRDHLANCYSQLYICDSFQKTANNLLGLVSIMNLAEKTSLEALLAILIEKEMIADQVVDLLWSIFCTKTPTSEGTSVDSALELLSMIGKAKPEILKSKVEVLRQVGFRDSDLKLCRLVCVALQSLCSQQRSFERLPLNHPLFSDLKTLILSDTNDLCWFPFAEQAFELVYKTAEHPDRFAGELLKRMHSVVFQNIKTSPVSLAKLLFLIGHTGIKQLVHLELIESEWKKKQTSSMDDLDQVNGSAEDEFSEAMALVKERELLFGSTSLLSKYAPLVSFVCYNNKTFDNSLVQTMAILSLCKLMCISSSYCSSHLQLLFTILEKSDNPIIRSNCIVGLGDMTSSFNSLIDQNISYLYNRLNDRDLTVKKNTLMVLTHLILNGMVKVKGQISEMAKCLQDSDQRISDLAKLFFTELSTKDNAVYNNLPDMISNLSHPTNGVSEDHFRSILKFLLEFIKKEKQSENIVDKLCTRFKQSDTQRQWRDVAFCLSLLSFTSEKSIKKLLESFASFSDKLHEPAVWKSFEEIVAKIKKNVKGDKVAVAEFEQKLLVARNRCLELHEGVLGLDVGEAMQELKLIQQTPKKPIRKKKKAVAARESWSSSEDENDPPSPKIPQKRSIKSSPAPLRSTRRATRNKS